MKKAIKALLIFSITISTIPANAETTWYQALFKGMDFVYGWATAPLIRNAGEAYKISMLSKNIKSQPFLFGSAASSLLGAFYLYKTNAQYREAAPFLRDLFEKVNAGELISEFDIAQVTILKLPNAPKRPAMHPDIQTLLGRIRQYNGTHADHTRRVRVAGDMAVDPTDRANLIQGIHACNNQVIRRVQLHYLGFFASLASCSVLNSIIGKGFKTLVTTVQT